MVTSQTRIYVTGFKVGDVDCRFGILWGGDPYLMTDWTRRQRDVEIEGLNGLSVFQLFGSGPRQITYRVFFESIADFKALDALVQETGTLRIAMNTHTVPVADSSHHSVLGKNYTTLTGVMLRSLVGLGVAPNGETEAEATFVVAS